ncbi:LCI8A [Auxenochlorella protothecoides x Auxenochlorella symbiontica]
MRGCSTLSLTPARCTSPLTYRVRTCTHRLGPTGPPSSTTNGTASTSAEAPSPQHAVVPARGLPGRDYGALDRTQYGLFVQFFRQASPYIEGHRGRTFVISIPGEVVSNRSQLSALLEDIALLHGLGVRLVLVLGTPAPPVSDTSSPYPVTDSDAMERLIQAAGLARLQVEAFLSKAPTVALARRHTRGKRGEPPTVHTPSLSVVSGNYLAAKRRGVVGGVDHGATGMVRHVAAASVAAQLAAGSIVVLSGLGFSAGGEPLACPPTGVAAAAAVALGADKLLLLTTSVALRRSRELSGWLPLRDAEALLCAALPDPARRADLLAELAALGGGGGGGGGEVPAGVGGHPDAAATAAPAPASPALPLAQRDLDFDLEKWAAAGAALPLLAACAACRAGVKRAHLVDAAGDGGLLLELYSRDGVGSMVSTDLYEGMRPAEPRDLGPIAELLRPLEEGGFLVRRSAARLAADLPHFTVWEREGRVLGCVAAPPLGDGVAELGAFAVHPAYRRLGKGDGLLECVEAAAAAAGAHTLVLLTTRTADWFAQRGFRHVGPAAGNALLPEARRAQVDPGRNSQLYAKSLA